MLDYLSVLERTRYEGTDLCFVGPPGVGKTSTAGRRPCAWPQVPAFPSAACTTRPRSAAPAHIGALPGQIINPPRRNQRPGDISRSTSWAEFPGRSGLGAARDPRSGAEQHVRDNYLDVPFDLSRCCLSVPPTCSTRYRRRCSTAWN